MPSKYSEISSLYYCSPAPQPEQCPRVRCAAHLRETLLVIRRRRAERGTVQYSTLQYSTGLLQVTAGSWEQLCDGSMRLLF